MLLLALLLVPTPQAVTRAPQAAAPATTAPAAAQAMIPILPVSIIARHPHDPTAFTQGLLWHDGALYESTGRLGESEVRRVELATGRVTKRARLPAGQFGEGLARWRGELISLTWHDGVAHRWRLSDLKPLGQLRYPGEGWGLAADERELVQSDGTPTLTIRDPATMAERRRIAVSYRGRPLGQLNELEWVNGAILANVWHEPFLARIDPASGRTTALIDLRPLVAEVKAADPEAVANGIAWDPQGKRLFVTGKLWPTVFEVRLPD